MGRTQYDDLPNILTPKDVQCFLGWKKDKVYALFRSRHFPSVKIGGSYIIPKPRFLRWLGVDVSDLQEIKEVKHV